MAILYPMRTKGFGFCEQCNFHCAGTGEETDIYIYLRLLRMLYEESSRGWNKDKILRA